MVIASDSLGRTEKVETGEKFWSLDAIYKSF